MLYKDIHLQPLSGENRFDFRCRLIKLLFRVTKHVSRRADEGDRNGDDFIYVNLGNIAGTMICTPSMKDPRIHYVT